MLLYWDQDFGFVMNCKIEIIPIDIGILCIDIYIQSTATAYNSNSTSIPSINLLSKYKYIYKLASLSF